MKQIFSLTLLIFFCLNAAAFEFNPNTVQEMDATITLQATGTFQGEVSNQDKAEIRFLVFQSQENQQVIEHTETLTIAGQTYAPEYEIEEENKFAVFKLDNLLNYANNPEFTITSITRIKTSVTIGLEETNFQQENFSQYLAETDYIETNDPTLQSKARLEFQSNNQLELTQQISQWVNSNIEYDFANYYNEVFSAKHTYDTRHGVCDEFANLSAAFARIKGIPAKYITGISFDGQRFGNHGWLEVYLDDYGWVGLDATFGEAGFVDGAHFILGQTIDANKLINLKITTQSIGGLTVLTELKQPQVEINDTKFFENITMITTEIPTKVYSKQQFTTKIKIKNTLDKQALMPIELAVHPDFLVDQKLRIENFAPNEEKELEWQIIAPEHTDRKTYLKYDVFVFTPDQNIKLPIEVHFGETRNEETTPLVFFDISPKKINEAILIELKIKNNSSQSQSGKITLKKDNEIIEEIDIQVEGYATQTQSIQVNGFSFGELELILFDGEQEKKISILIPKEKEKEIEVVPQENFEDNVFDLVQNQQIAPIIAILGIGLITILLAVILAYRKLKQFYR